MTFAKTLALALGFVGAVVLGVWIAPHLSDQGARAANAIGASQAPPVIEKQSTQPEVQRAPPSHRAISRPVRTTATALKTSPEATSRTVPSAAPALHEVLKPLLNKGADMSVASQDFDDAEQFAAVAHAARNTEVPFMVLKHRILVEGRSLEEAIRELKPGLNAAVEANRARAEAKSDIVALLG